MNFDRYQNYKAQAAWRERTAERLKKHLGCKCSKCQDELNPEELSLVIPNRRGPDLQKYGQNTVTIYSHILKGKLPSDRILLLCRDCQFLHRIEEKKNDTNMD